MDEIVTVYVTTSNREEALQLARQAVEARLAACGNILDQVTSVFRWEGRLQEESEAVLLLKTRASLVPELTDRLKQWHRYECPCVVAWRCVGGNDEYLKWVRAETQPDNPKFA